MISFSAKVISICCKLLLFWGCGYACLATAEEPEELVTLRQIYINRLQEVKKPVTQSYIEALGRVQADLNQSGDLNAALLVLQERKRLARLMKSKVTKEVPVTIDSRSKAEEGSTGYNPAGSKWTWVSPAKEIEFLKNGIARVWFPRLGEDPIPHFWKRLSPLKIKVWYENGSRVFTFTVDDSLQSGAVAYGESNSVAEVFLISSGTQISQ